MASNQQRVTCQDTSGQGKPIPSSWLQPSSQKASGQVVKRLERRDFSKPGCHQNQAFKQTQKLASPLTILWKHRGWVGILILLKLGAIAPASTQAAELRFKAWTRPTAERLTERSSYRMLEGMSFAASPVELNKTEAIAPLLLPPTTLAQVPPDDLPENLPEDFLPQDPIPEEELPQRPLPTLPPPEELLPRPDQPPATPDAPPGELPATLQVNRYEVIGSTVFSEEELAEVTAPYTGNVTFTELLQARSAVTQLYTSNGYITSGAFIPPQTLEDGVVTIQVVEGSLEEINVTGLGRLNSSYVADRLAIAGSTPLNVDRLLEGLQLLQLDPLIRNLSADLETGTRPGTNLLNVEVTEADPFQVDLTLNNGRSPSVGSFRRQISALHRNLFGFGDSIFLSYTNTEGSDGFDASYTIPINPRNGTLRFAAGVTNSDVIEEPFNILDIQSESRYFELSLRQPLYQTTSEEFALGFTAAHQRSQTELGFLGPFPLSPGADNEGRTRITSLRFFQEWTQRSSRHVLAARSQFSVGVDFLDATVNEGLPDSRFVAWRGQGQWVRLLGRDFLLLLRSDVQLSGDDLFSQEQFGLGGQNSIRGYRQDLLLTDNGILTSAELRIPVARIPELDGLLQIIPFIDVGAGWNNRRPDPDPDTLLGAGLGLQLQLGDRFTARLDWGIPLVEVDSSGDSLQEDGIYFTVNYSAF